MASGVGDGAAVVGEDAGLAVALTGVGVGAGVGLGLGTGVVPQATTTTVSSVIQLTAAVRRALSLFRIFS